MTEAERAGERRRGWMKSVACPSIPGNSAPVGAVAGSQGFAHFWPLLLLCAQVVPELLQVDIFEAYRN